MTIDISYNCVYCVMCSKCKHFIVIVKRILWLTDSINNHYRDHYIIKVVLVVSTCLVFELTTWLMCRGWTWTGLGRAGPRLWRVWTTTMSTDTTSMKIPGSVQTGPGPCEKVQFGPGRINTGPFSALITVIMCAHHPFIFTGLFVTLLFRAKLYTSFSA